MYTLLWIQGDYSMKLTGIALLSAAALLAASSVSAGGMDNGSDISWTYGQLGFVRPDSSSVFGAEDANGYDVAAGFGIGKHWHVGGRWDSLNVLIPTGSGNDTTVDSWQVGGGFNLGLTTHSQGYIDLNYVGNRFSGGNNPSSGTGKVNGFNLTTGLRFKPVPALELGAGITYAERQFAVDSPNPDFHEIGRASCRERV